jgi:DNA polymerase
MEDVVPSIKSKRLESLKSICLKCRKCKLCEERKNIVFGEGNPYASIICIGEGPGRQEDATGRPFVGRFKQLQKT